MRELKEMLSYTGMDVEKLVNDYTETLHDNNNERATEEGSIVALKEWAREKEYLIRQVMAMPGYNGNLQSVVELEVPNLRKLSDVRRSIDFIWMLLFDNGNKILSKRNSDGKTLTDVIEEESSNIPSMININDLSLYGKRERKTFSEFNSVGITLKSLKDKDTAYRIINDFLRDYMESRLSAEMADLLNKANPDIRASEGMKTTRALGKVIKIYGLEDKTAGSVYTKTFIADYCEVMREGGTKYLYVISVNPIDYLKMSIGQFTSCHNINGGGWRSGTIAYMLDKVSMITYTIKKNQLVETTSGEIITGKDRPELFSKIHRNVFHWDIKHRLIQSRVYPQGNEGCTDLYKVFRNEVQRQLSIVNGWEIDNWTQRKRKYMDFTVAGENSTNYQDWAQSHFGGNLSTPGHSYDEYSTDEFVIGAQPTCIVCGRKHSSSNRMKCWECY